MESLFVLGRQGTQVLEKHWGSSPCTWARDWFWRQAVAAGHPSQLAPVLAHSHHVLVHVERGQLCLLAVRQGEGSPLMYVELLERIADVFEVYFYELSEDALRDHFITAYQLLDEMVEDGNPLHTELNVLQELILPPGQLKAVVAAVTGQPLLSGELPKGALSDTPWRRAGVSYTTNEIVFDVVERLDATFDGSSSMLRRSSVQGTVRCSCHLSGSPRLAIRLNSARGVDDIAFHRCVHLPSWDKERLIRFCPPDGHFELLTYRAQNAAGVPIYVSPSFSFPPARCETGEPTASCYEGRVQVTIGARRLGALTIEDVVVHLPLPLSVQDVTMTASFGTFHFNEATKRCSWYIGRLPRDVVPMLSGTIVLDPKGRLPHFQSFVALAEFSIAGHSVSGLRIEDIRMERESFPFAKVVRTTTAAGCFQVRT